MTKINSRISTTAPSRLTPKPFQITARDWITSRKYSYIAADAGTGKTIMAALAINRLKIPVVYVCPPFLALNTQFELEKWNTWDARVSIFGADNRLDFDPSDCDILIIPDSLLDARAHEIGPILSRLTFGGAILIIDEAHRFKTAAAKRSLALFDFFIYPFKHIVFLSGTPMPNGRPMELYPILSRAVPETIDHKNMHSFGMRYCAGRLVHTYAGNKAWDYSGNSNTNELFSNLRKTFMHRIRKEEVLHDLPPRTTAMVILADNLPPQIATLDRQMVAKYSPSDLVRSEIAPDSVDATYLRLIGMAKAKLAVTFIKGLLEDTNECALVFARHKTVIEKLKIGLDKFKPLVITGSTPKGVRHDLVKQFQTKSANRVFILNQEAGGLGLTLTKANLVFQVEPSWVPGVNDQAADRAHRIGQTRVVHERYLVYKNSMDRAVIESNLKKRNVIDQI